MVTEQAARLEKLSQRTARAVSGEINRNSMQQQPGLSRRTSGTLHQLQRAQSGDLPRSGAQLQGTVSGNGELLPGPPMDVVAANAPPPVRGLSLPVSLEHKFLSCYILLSSVHKMTCN